MSDWVLPVLPLRGMVVFPLSVTTLDVGRKSSLIAVERALSEGNEICLLLQKDPIVEFPQIADLYTVGVLAEIRQLIKLPGSLARVIVEGVKRIEVEEVLSTEPFLQIKAQALETEVDEDTEETKALTRAVMDAFVKYTSLNQHMAVESVTPITDLDMPEKMVDLLGGNLSFDYFKKQKLLELRTINERLEALLTYLYEEIDVLKIEKRIHKQVQKKIEETQKEYYLREQLKIIQKELEPDRQQGSEIDVYRESVEKLKQHKEVYEKLQHELRRLAKLPFGAAERGVIENYIEWCLALPWDTLDRQPIDIAEAKAILDMDHFGLEKVKERILEYIAVLQLTDQLKGPIICLVGPPGVGKTSLARSIAKALGRAFVSSSLGGVRDEAEIRGHRRTYVGAMPGRIIQALKRVKTRDPLFLFDEIDKMSNDFRGDPASALLEVLDPEQNNHFIDHYLDLPFDLSKVVFLTTANATHNIPAPLLDRMEIIYLSGYTEDEKVQIANRHLFGKQLALHGLNTGQLSINERALRLIIRTYTREAGVRSLERALAAICRKVAHQLVAGKRKRIRITERNLRKYLGKPMFRLNGEYSSAQPGVATALAWTETGGVTMPVEVALSEGKGQLMLTGQLGDVMKESAQTALSYVRSHALQLGLEHKTLKNTDIHVHIPQGAIPKDGPSAGITIAVALISALKGVAVKAKTGFTGEITLHGRVLPIGGLKEKLLAAHRDGLKTVILPAANEEDLIDIPRKTANALQIITAKTMDEVLEAALGEYYDHS